MKLVVMRIGRFIDGGDAFGSVSRLPMVETNPIFSPLRRQAKAVFCIILGEVMICMSFVSRFRVHRSGLTVNAEP